MCAAGVLSVAAAILYNGVMYRFGPTYIMLIAAAVVAVAMFILAGFKPKAAAYLPICGAGLLASAAIWGTQLMVNQLGYVYAGLDGMDTIMSWIWFVAVTAVAMILCIVAAFGKTTEEKAA